MASRKYKMAKRAIEIAEDYTHGYSQKPPSGRWGPDYDCSSFIYSIADYAGYPVGTGYSDGKVRFTGTMLKDFKDAGFQILPFANVGLGDLEIGDILLNLALHAEVYVGEGQTVGALSSENGGYTGEAGDQTGQEIAKHPAYILDKGWDYVLRPPDDSEDPSEEESDTGGTDMASYPYSNGTYGYNGNYGQTQTWSPMRNGGYPQGGNLGQMNGYSQANAGYPQPNYYGNQQTMPMGPQGYSSPQQLNRVHGMEGARNYQVQPNSCVALFDENEDILYIKSADQQGFPNIRVFQMTEMSENMDQHSMPMGPQGYVTRQEFEELKGMLEDAKQLISTDKQSSTNTGRGRNS